MDIFISYSHDDKDIAQEIYNIIKKYRFNPILDDINIMGGEELDSKIVNLLEKSFVVVGIISRSSIQSPWVIYEIAIADYIGKEIVPFLVKPDLTNELPAFLQKRKAYTSLKDLEVFFKNLCELDKLEKQESVTLSLCWSGLKKIYKSRSRIPNYFQSIIKDAKETVRAVFVSGNFLSAVDFESIVKKKIKDNVKFRILLLDPEKKDVRNKDLPSEEYKLKESEWDTILSTISNLSNVEVRFYNIYPFWHIILVDNASGAISFNPRGKLGYSHSPVYIFENNHKCGNFFEIFDNYFEIIWRDSSPCKKQEDTQVK